MPPVVGAPPNLLERRDLAYIEQWVERLEVTEAWRRLVQSAEPLE